MTVWYMCPQLSAISNFVWFFLISDLTKLPLVLPRYTLYFFIIFCGFKRQLAGLVFLFSSQVKGSWLVVQFHVWSKMLLTRAWRGRSARFQTWKVSDTLGFQSLSLSWLSGDVRIPCKHKGQSETSCLSPLQFGRKTVWSQLIHESAVTRAQHFFQVTKSSAAPAKSILQLRAKARAVSHSL